MYLQFVVVVAAAFPSGCLTQSGVYEISCKKFTSFLWLSSSLRMALTDNTMTHTTLAEDVPFPTCTREKSMRCCRKTWEREWEIERDRVELRCIKQHCRVASSAVCTKRNGNWNTNTNTHTHTAIALLLSRVVLSLTALPLSLALAACCQNDTRTLTHTHGGSFSLQFTRWCE